MKNDQASKVQEINFKEGNLKGIKLFLNKEYASIVYPNGNTDAEMVKEIENSIPTGKIIFDVGTFIGSSCLVFSKLVGKRGKVIGFEPNPYNLERIEKSLSLNSNLAKNIKIYPIALSDKEGEMLMTLSSEIDNGYSSTSRLNKSHPKLNNKNLPSGFKEVMVDVMTLDEFVRRYEIIPDILKLDIEGAEYDLLVGGEQTIRDYRPDFYIEMHSEFCSLKCADFLKSLGYEFTVLKEEQDNRIMVKAVYSEDGLFASNNAMKMALISYENSNSWKLTKPLRFLLEKLREIFSKGE